MRPFFSLMFAALLAACSSAPPPPKPAPPPPKPTAAPLAVEHLTDDPAHGRPPGRIDVAIPTPVVQEVVLDNGLRAWLIEDHGQPVVSIVMSVTPPATGWNAAFVATAGVLPLMTDRAGKTLDDQVKALGSDAAHRVSDLGIDLWAEVLPEDVPAVAQGMVRTLREGKVTAADVAIGWRRAESVAFGGFLAVEEVLPSLFPAGHPLHLAAPEQAKFNALKPAEVDKMRAAMASPDRVSFAVVGDISPAALKDALQAAAGTWAAPKPVKTKPSKASATDPMTGVFLVDHGWRSSTAVAPAFPLLPSDHADAPKLWLLAFSLVRGTAERAAEKTGETYASTPRTFHRGSFEIFTWSFDVPRGRATASLEALRDELGAMTANTADATRGKIAALRALAGGRSIDERARTLRTAMGSHASPAAFMRFFEAVRDADRAAVAAAAATHLPRSALRVVAVGNVQFEQPGISALGFANITSVVGNP